MRKSIVMTGLACLLSAPLAMAGHFGLIQGDLLDTDKIDIDWKQQYGANCVSPYPVESMDCAYIAHKLGGVMAKYIKVLSITSLLTTENTFLFTITLNAATEAQGYPFDAASCSNLQTKVATGDVIVVNKTGCSIREHGLA
ncbi:MAG: hypothetical protein NTW94_07530 [Legionellales bacterium]|nr:hypothetical protein [Legionellales bacterium]